MKQTHFLTITSVALLLAFSTSAPAVAIDFDIAANLKVSDDVQLFVNLSNDITDPIRRWRWRCCTKFRIPAMIFPCSCFSPPPDFLRLARSQHPPHPAPP